jgi:hypothetical protein
MEFLSDFLSWAWMRHHNVLSWYIRPLFILPFVLFAYRRSWKGLVLTVIALLTSMFWFSAPTSVDPGVEQFLRAEKEYILGEWTMAKVLVSLTVPAFFYFLGLAFWKRSWVWGLVVINLAASAKVAWSVATAGDSGWAVLIPALVGLAICDAAVFLGVKLIRNRRFHKITS